MSSSLLSHRCPGEAPPGDGEFAETSLDRGGAVNDMVAGLPVREFRLAVGA